MATAVFTDSLVCMLFVRSASGFAASSALIARALVQLSRATRVLHALAVSKRASSSNAWRRIRVVTSRRFCFHFRHRILCAALLYRDIAVLRRGVPGELSSSKIGVSGSNDDSAGCPRLLSYKYRSVSRVQNSSWWCKLITL